MWKDGVRFKGFVRIIDTKTGEILREAQNVVVNTGISFIVSLLSGGSEIAMGYTAVGSGQTAPATGNSALESQIGSRAAGAVSSTAYTITWQTTYAAGVCTGNWYEAGVFNAASGPKMLCHVSFGLLTKAANDSFTLQYIVSAADDGV